ncbi:hypothetical protein CHELA40_40217 [Chelatococcus asaccharovorans]|nr:hypothetical protein CHELA40_40217 [Chelatococcus asaccharovorans]
MNQFENASIACREARLPNLLADAHGAAGDINTGCAIGVTDPGMLCSLLPAPVSTRRTLGKRFVPARETPWRARQATIEATLLGACLGGETCDRLFQSSNS